MKEIRFGRTVESVVSSELVKCTKCVFDWVECYNSRTATIGKCRPEQRDDNHDVYYIEVS